MHNKVVILTAYPVTIWTLLCFELHQIQDHFYYTNAPHLYSKSGLGFVLTPSIAKKWGGLHNGFWIFPPFWQSWNSGKTSIIEDRSVFREILVCGASETKNKVPIGLEIKFCIFGTILSLLAKAIDFWRFAGGLPFPLLALWGNKNWPPVWKWESLKLFRTKWA